MTITTTSRTRSADFDVLIIGAGISGIGAACHLKASRPGTSFAVLEGRDSIGGTWSLFQYPGIRSDSDMPTFGFGFKPWPHRKSIADGHLILDYLRQAVAENGVTENIRLGHRVLSADFSSAEGRWTVTAQRSGSGETVTLTARFLFLGTGYYDYESGFTPEFPGAADFEGRVVHPQHWPPDLDYRDRRVVVIGSGATAVTLIPSMAAEARHVTMLQRSPSYVLSIPAEDAIARVLNKVLGRRRAHQMVRRKNIAVSRAMFKASRRAPKLMRRLLIASVRRQLPAHFDVDTHFTPRYKPWDQRLCMVPDGDLFKAISTGKASVVTDRIDRFTRAGIRLDSGQELAADVVVTATGLTMSPFGEIRFRVDGGEVNLPETTFYKAMMLSGVPNLAVALGYTNISWTLKVDLVCEHFCRLLEHMDSHGYDVVEPVLDDPGMERVPAMDLSAGYVRRGIGKFPRAGTRGPWTVEHAYEKDVARLREGPVEDSALKFTRKPAHRSEEKR
ncbi:Predicted flavoprotein CzcO associated with the cation diffusion facilitator CzcD [Saccharopolyspora antimicrobica]|uniref:Cation diffusion facilitator CzcD-associated flavoprotein CzcO n=1 Tax=Saccharopolyspora antimicrobica TaxID=455193 RepID=A0A1I4VLV2_9PSEU|nr:NAD(P)/FAD-dependent oxidoreductase [Saccharopolyspora antimicrobica]RKT87318.1 cation diffusion facilitator CzcD-associated flavoprotein CzcO [Saccharopolyspora antimicrobica]SFN01966.1 Predicted flavoprotein CzcO associated with the cation diffusion facilitator CzcD [Saccharopolyspora antimicrobica]